jgi:hypothetical protein
MTIARKCALVVGFVGCVMSMASLGHIDSRSRVAFDNHGYPPDIGVELWLDDGIDVKLTRATCTIDHCETEPLLIDKGRHRIRLRVLIDDQASPFTETTIQR